MEKIKRFIECLIPVTVCNLKCHYCYVIQEKRATMEQAQMNYTPETIAAALSKKRLGGVCFISICGAGETLAAKGIIEIIKHLLLEGHFVNITTNGTLSHQFEQIALLPFNLRERLHISFSMHYLELKRLNLIDIFFNNIQKCKKMGGWFIQINLNDEYIPFIEEMKGMCLKKVGAYPQVCATRDELKNKNKIELHTSLSSGEYLNIGREFESPLFECTMKNFNIKRKEFCYAGDWSAVLNLATGEWKACYSASRIQNVFEDITKPIHFEALGKNCGSLYCMNSSHFLSLGNIPELSLPTYAELRNRKEAGWYTDRMCNFLGSRLSESNQPYSALRKNVIMVRRIPGRIVKVLRRMIPSVLKQKIKMIWKR